MAQSHVTHSMAQVASSARAFFELGRRQSIMRAYTSSINCLWMDQALGLSGHQQQQQQQQQLQQQPDPLSLPPHLSLCGETIGCLSGPIVRCMQTAEFVQVSQINACALALSCLLKQCVASAPFPPPSLSSTAEIFHRFGVPGKLPTSNTQRAHLARISSCVQQYATLAGCARVCSMIFPALFCWSSWSLGE